MTCVELAIPAGGSALLSEFLSECVELAYLSCLLLRVLYDAAGGIPCPASRFPSALLGESGVGPGLNQYLSLPCKFPSVASSPFHFTPSP